MLDIQCYNFNYDRAFLNLEENQTLKQYVNAIYAFLVQNVADLDFTHITATQFDQIIRIREMLISPENANSAVVHHLINYYSLSYHPNAEQENGLLHHFCAFGNFAAVEYICEYYTDINVNRENHILQTPLFFAVAVGNSPQIANYLMEKGAQIHNSCEDPDTYTIGEAFYICRQHSTSSEEFFDAWANSVDSLLFNNDVKNSIEEKYNDLFREIEENEFSHYSKRSKNFG